MSVIMVSIVRPLPVQEQEQAGLKERPFRLSFYRREVMLDYTLVSPKATYRILTPADMPSFLRMVQAARAERGGPNLFDPGPLLATIKALQPSRGKGSIFVFERDRLLVGYCVLVNCWSTEQCGTVLVADELYVIPELRVLDLAGDFLLLVAKVAPEGSTSIRIELPRRGRESAPFAAIGFRKSEREVHSLRIGRPVPGGSPARAELT
jgi:hypothetical protein